MTSRTGDRDARLADCALSRFGLGARAGDLRRVGSDPRGALLTELAKPNVALLPDPYLVSSAVSTRAYLERKALRAYADGRELKGGKLATIEMMRADGRLPPKKPAAGGSKSRADGDDMSDSMGAGSAAKRAGAGADVDMRDLPFVEKRPIYEETAARFVHSRARDVGYVERLVQFWCNHFTVSTKSGGFINWVAGAYEREAIRPHALGRFEDLLLAATRHPAMLHYLNNAVSVGPTSRRGGRTGKGLNENHARELLELHTVGVSGGYDQADVIALAKILTGWSVTRGIKSEDVGTFAFDADAHEPGGQTVMGVAYREGGVEQGEAALRDLAGKPATAKHVARRMAISFVADDPPPALVDRLTRVFLETDGDLKALSTALISSDAAWDAPRAKMRSPRTSWAAS